MATEAAREARGTMLCFTCPDSTTVVEGCNRGAMARQYWSKTRIEFESLRPRNLGTVSRFLARVGRDFDRRLKRHYVDPAFDASDGTSWFVPAVSLALLWSRHARISDDEQLSDYMDFAAAIVRGETGTSGDYVRYAWRFGPDSLERSLEGYQAVLRECPELARGSTFPSPGHVHSHQNRMIGALLEHPVLSQTPGVGAWLGLAPYKILLIHRDDWWDLPECDQPLQPLGTIAERALRTLSKAGIVSADELALLTADDDSVGTARQDAFTSVTLAQGIQARLARAADSRVMHINSALYDLGTENR